MAGIGTDAGWWKKKKRKLPYKKVALTSYYVKMSDGVRIALDLYLPAKLREDEKLPAILRQTRSYRRYKVNWPFSMFMGKSSSDIYSIIRKFVRHGYAFVNFDVRGTGASFGSRTGEWSKEELNDNLRIVDWIIDKPWSNGIIGLMGKAYGGTAAEMLIAERHPAVKAALLQYCHFDFYSELLCPGGIKNELFLSKSAYFNRLKDDNKIDPQIPALERFVIKLIYDGVAPVDSSKKDAKLLQSAISRHEKNYDVYENLENIKFRDDLAKNNIPLDEMSPHSRIDRLKEAGIPVYSWSGWYDGAFPLSAVRRFLNVKTPGSKLILGPWDQYGNQTANPGFMGSSKTNFNHAGEMLRFFDYHLQGISTGIEIEAPIHYYTLVENKWKATTRWPIHQYEDIPFYLRINKLIVERATSKIDGSDKFTFDYEASSGPISRWYSQVNADKRDIGYYYSEENEDFFLTYTSPPLERAFELTGHPTLTLYVKSNQPEAQLFVYLEDMDLDGHIYYVTEGMIRTCNSYIQSENLFYEQPIPCHSYKREDETLFREHFVTTIRFALLPVSYLYKKTRSIRLSIAGADKDNFEVLDILPAELEIFHGNVYSSKIVLPGKFIDE